MSPVKSPSEVQDLLDLIDLYANLDRNGDGRLGPDELSEEEIATADLGRDDPARPGRDGFLSPWEVARKQGLDDAQFKAMNWNHIHYARFRDGAPVEGSLTCFHARFPNIRLTGNFFPNQLIRLMKTLEGLSPDARQSIREIHRIKRPANVGAWEHARTYRPNAYPSHIGHTIYLFEDDEDGFLPESIGHEAAHLLTSRLEEQLAERIQRLTSHLDFTSPEGAAEELAIVRRETANSFEGRWTKIAKSVDGNGYGKRVSFSGDTRNPTSWSTRDASGSAEGPRYGYMRSYGGRTFGEDVATHMEIAAIAPNVYRQLIDPSSKFYRYYPEQVPFASIYRAKLNLLREYGFITEAKYREIAPLHPTMAAFCQTVNCP